MELLIITIGLATAIINLANAIIAIIKSQTDNKNRD